jgi:hypothetical protein
VLFRVDGNDVDMTLNNTNFADGPKPIFSADNLGDGDHDLFVLINSLQPNGTIAVDYIEYVILLLPFFTITVFQQSRCF